MWLCVQLALLLLIPAFLFVGTCPHPASVDHGPDCVLQSDLQGQRVVVGLPSASPICAKLWGALRSLLGMRDFEMVDQLVLIFMFPYLLTTSPQITANNVCVCRLSLC